MPNIPIYDAPNRTFEPSEAGASTLARAGARIGIMTREAGALRQQGANALERGLDKLGTGTIALGRSISDIQAGHEISDFTSALATTHEKLDNSWNQVRLGTDPSVPVGDKWRTETAFPELDKLLEGVSTDKGREHARNMIDNAKMHYATSTHAGDMAAAGDNAVRNMTTVVNAATRRSQQDFTTIEYNNQLIRDSYEGAIKTGGFDLSTALKLRGEADKAVKENVIAGIQGAADRNPFQLAGELKGMAEKYNLSGVEVEHIEKYIKAQQKSKEADARNAAIDQSIATQKKSEAYAQKLLNDLPKNPDGTIAKWPSMSEILTDKNLTIEKRRELWGIANTAQKEPATKDDADTYNTLRKGVGDRSDPTSRDDVIEAYQGKKITEGTMHKLLDRMSRMTDKGEQLWETDTKAAVNATNQALKIGQIGMDDAAPYQADAARQWLDDYVEEARNQSRPGGAIARHDIFDPTSKYYYAKQQAYRDILNNSEQFQVIGKKPAQPSVAPDGTPIIPRNAPPTVGPDGMPKPALPNPAVKPTPEPEPAGTAKEKLDQIWKR